MQTKAGSAESLVLGLCSSSWLWSGARDYTGRLSGRVSAHPILPIDRTSLPADERTRL